MKTNDKLIERVNCLYKRAEESPKGYDGWRIYNLAAETAEEAGLTRRAIKIYEEVAEIYGKSQVGIWSSCDAARIAKEAGMTERAMENYKKAIKKLKDCFSWDAAVDLAKKVGLTERPMGNCEYLV